MSSATGFVCEDEGNIWNNVVFGGVIMSSITELAAFSSTCILLVGIADALFTALCAMIVLASESIMFISPTVFFERGNIL